MTTKWQHIALIWLSGIQCACVACFFISFYDYLLTVRRDKHSFYKYFKALSSFCFISCHHTCMASVCCQREFIISQCIYSYNFVNSWNLFALLMLTQFTLDSNDSKLSTSWEQYMQCINLFHLLNLAWLSEIKVLDVPFIIFYDYLLSGRISIVFVHFYKF